MIGQEDDSFGDDRPPDAEFAADTDIQTTDDGLASPEAESPAEETVPHTEDAASMMPSLLLPFVVGN